MNSLSRFAGTAVALVAALTLATTAHAAGDPTKCKEEIGKDFAKYVQAETKALQKCRESIVKATFGGSCPDTANAAKIAKAETKMRTGIAKKCGGSTKSCTDGDAVLLSDISWDMGTCPNIHGGSCQNAIANCNDISDCLVCTGTAAVDEVMSLYYDDLASGQFGLNSPTNKCQLAIGKNASKFIEAKNKALQKCEDGKLKGTILTACPDATKAQPAIDKAESKKRAGICKACGGPDKTCDGVGDTSPGLIGFVPKCPTVTIPGGASCSVNIVSTNDIVDCVDCVSNFKADCLDALSVPAIKPYPAECNPPAVPPCPTPQNTATPCPTATPAIVCPSQVVTEANGADADLDTGWTGISHDAHVPSMGRLTLAVSGCTHPGGPSSSTCGDCVTNGPLPNAGGPTDPHNNHRCVGDTAITCSVDGDCGANGPCSFFFGAPLPLSSGGIAVCVTNRVTQPITGTVNIESGATVTDIQLQTTVYVGGPNASPCPQCVGNLCASGPHINNACQINGHSDLFGDVSFDCPPDPAQNAANFPIPLHYDTGAQTVTLSAASPNCSTVGFTGDKCFCDTCNDAAGTPCMSNADCTEVGHTICGGRRCQGGPLVGTPCLVSSDCQRCVGGGNDGNACLVDGDCAPRLCNGGVNNGNVCSLTCAGGPNNGSACTLDSQCQPVGHCTSNSQCPGVCIGGANAGASCTDASVCPGGGTCSGTCDGSCQGGCGVPGVTTQPNGCDNGICLPTSTCQGGCNAFLNCSGAFKCYGGANTNHLCTVDSECPGGACSEQCPGGACVTGNEGKCSSPLEFYCKIQTFTGCGADSDCPAPGDSCTLNKLRDCYLDNGNLGGTVTASGVPYPACGNVGSGAVGALFCVSPTSSGSVNGVSGLPGLGRITLPYTATFLP